VRSAESNVRVAVIAGSRRPNNRSKAVADWVRAGAPDTAEVTVIDLEDIALPTLAEPSPPAFGEYTLPHTREWSALIAGYDAFVLVSPEYNHSTTAALKNALDHLYFEWHDKAVAFVGYGLDGGVRAVEHLRGITAELGMAGVGPTVALSLSEDFDGDGHVAPRERQELRRARMLDGLLRWATALRPLRDTVDEPGGDTGDKTTRPALHRQGDASSADGAVSELVRQLQKGLDSGDADLYDSTFAEDVLWGGPYGSVLAGYPSLNVAHHSILDASGVARSRYEVVQTSAPAPDLVLTHVRRRSLADAADGGGPDFSEMALYVLVRRGGRWWLAAGQNTPIRDKA